LTALTGSRRGGNEEGVGFGIHDIAIIIHHFTRFFKLG
jgi:hypothetical protein